MKTIKNILTEEIKRVPDKKAFQMVSNKGWSFCPKKEWKAIRDKNKKRPEEKPKKSKESKKVDKVDKVDKDSKDYKKPYQRQKRS